MVCVNSKNTSLLLALILVLVLIPAALFSVTEAFGTTVVSAPSSSSSLNVSPAPLFYQTPASSAPTCSTKVLCPSMLTQAYGFNTLFESGVSGRGQTVVIVDACGDPTIASDLNMFDKQFGLPSPVLTVNYFEGTSSGNKCIQSWAGEVALDVEWAHVTAPHAAIDLLVSQNAGAEAMYLAWTYAFNHNLGNQISDSWGGSGCYVKPCINKIGEGIGPCTLTNGTQGVNVTALLDRAAKLHVTVLDASGDSGAFGLGTKQEETVPESCTGVLDVGGTTLHVSASGNYLRETGWAGSGGGYMTAPSEPQYQKIANIEDPYGTLAKPDVSADASCHSAVWVAVEGGWYGICGTSLATPLWAGFMADVNQIRTINGFAPAGYINRFLYDDVYTNAKLYAEDFHDVTTGNNGYAAGPGWDPVTGLGSFNAPNLARTLGINPTA